jgi:EAL domain-containing protein (putative c-di-GMP-specific phosphodiesterase class I)
MHKNNLHLRSDLNTTNTSVRLKKSARRDLYLACVVVVCLTLLTTLLELESTETALMEDFTATQHTLKQLRECGISIAIDDFGTGFSSLGRLKELQVDKLIIDRSFVNESSKNKVSENIVKTIISFSQNMEMKVIAEGVETTEQANLLLDLGCDHQQGYLFSKLLRLTLTPALFKNINQIINNVRTV